MRDLLAVVPRLVWLALILASALVTLQAQTNSYDLVIRNARIVDGTGSPWYRGDIAVRNDAIVAMARRIEDPQRV